MQHSPTAVAVSTSFLLNHFPQQPELNALTTRFRELYSSVSMSRESKRLKKSRSNWLNSGNALIDLSQKMRFSCFPVLPDSAEENVIWGCIVKWVLIAYFMGNISAKKYQNVLTYVKIIAKQTWDVFWDTVYLQWALLSPKLPLPTRIWTTSHTWFLGPIPAHNSNGISISAAVFAQVPILYNGTPLPLKLAPFHGDQDPI